MFDVCQEIKLTREWMLKDLQLLDHEDFKSHCLKCRLPIFGKATSFTKQDMKYYFHPKCFTCTQCDTNMEGKAFYEHQGGHVCQSCYQQKVMGTCAGCDQSFTSPLVIKVEGKQFHPQCFKCFSCNNQITENYVKKLDACYCKACHDKQLPKCSGCKKYIQGDQFNDKLAIIEWGDRKYHTSCFSCVECRTMFSDLRAMLYQDDLVCKSCFDKLTSQ